MLNARPVIVADENISHIEQALAGHRAEVRLFRDAEQDGLRPLLRDADALLCRSTIKVNAALLEGSPLRFVATATSGTDHFDIPWLDAQGIGYEAAMGSNARSVAEYVFNALFTLEQRKGLRFRDRTLGIVGVGHVGSQVRAIAEGLGMQTILCDPPLHDATGDERYRPFAETVRMADILTLHVPLTSNGRYPTHALVDAGVCYSMKPGAVLINTARGGVIVESHMNEAIASGRFSGVVLDVFDREPDVHRATAIAADIATPHIAGHAYDGKLLGTQMVYDGLCRRLGWQVQWDYRDALPPADAITLDYDVRGREQKLLSSLLRRVYDVRKDHEALLAIIQERDQMRGRAFREYRSNYRKRRECSAYTVRLRDTETPFAQQVRALGFIVKAIE